MNAARKPLTTTVLGQAEVKNWLIIFHFLEFIMHSQFNTVCLPISCELQWP